MVKQIMLRTFYSLFVSFLTLKYAERLVNPVVTISFLTGFFGITRSREKRKADPKGKD